MHLYFPLFHCHTSQYITNHYIIIVSNPFSTSVLFISRQYLLNHSVYLLHLSSLYLKISSFRIFLLFPHFTPSLLCIISPSDNRNFRQYANVFPFPLPQDTPIGTMPSLSLRYSFCQS
ncbi:MAG: hypothetical protein [Circular genetic element sp.]|nr:MAG: hypothetical protein [Circular genetic element sp.]